MAANIDAATVRHFGREWSDFDQQSLGAAELQMLFERYFSIFPWHLIDGSSVGLDFGCGSGRWASLVAPRVGRLHCVDASAAALAVAARNLAGLRNVETHLASAEELPFSDGSLDFAYSLGVLHHLPDTAAGIRACVRKLRVGAPFLLYLYYRFDNRSRWFRLLWLASDLVRRVVSRSPHRIKVAITGAIAAGAYWPAARLSQALAVRGVDVSSVPLSFYKDASFYTMRTDALDRFGTPLERRFTADEIREMMEAAGLEGVRFSSREPFWCAVGTRAGSGVGQ